MIHAFAHFKNSVGPGENKIDLAELNFLLFGGTVLDKESQRPNP